MKDKKIMKVISIAVIIFLIASAFMPVFADDLTDPSQFNPSAGDSGTTVQTAINTILGIVQIVAAGVAVIMLIVLAIKYISASPEGKADVKKTAVQYVVGAVLLFGASGILGIVRTFAKDVVNTGA